MLELQFATSTVIYLGGEQARPPGRFLRGACPNKQKHNAQPSRFGELRNHFRVDDDSIKRKQTDGTGGRVPSDLICTIE